MKWNSGDITWLPSYKISHLQVLKNYLDAHGVDQISQLPPGKGNPRVDDPQILLNLINLKLHHTRPASTEIVKYRKENTSTPQFRSHTTTHSTGQTYSHFNITDTTMTKRRWTPPNIDHPLFSKHGQNRILANTTTGTVTIQAAQLLELIKHNAVLRSTPAERVICRPIPLGYDLIARTWNNPAPPASPQRFAVLTQTDNQSQPPIAIVTGEPMSMTDFHLTIEDCGLPTTSPANSELLALTHYVAMGTIRGQQKRDARQYRRHNQHVTAFSNPKFKPRNICRR